ncbi:hypothetical protein E2562_000130 [Oryza meyeriana var. granulata]|uniref:Uncharacterized protein n=1 Tax=Oryza meyeriana var. granulata TaxID=110450 RepID=A0A6G1DBL2_9ORYZ|nr:hypothetical protein E2562_000130 [Oryza meyeriana var. granulata]
MAAQLGGDRALCWGSTADGACKGGLANSGALEKSAGTGRERRSKQNDWSVRIWRRWSIGGQR